MRTCIYVCMRLHTYVILHTYTHIQPYQDMLHRAAMNKCMLIKYYTGRSAHNDVTSSRSCTDLEESITLSWGKAPQSRPIEQLSDDVWLKEWISLSAENQTTPLVPH